MDIYDEMIAACRDLAASFPSPRFYTCCAPWLDLSQSVFNQKEQIKQCRSIVFRELRDNLGHGMDHAEKVALEAGALAYIEGERLLLKDGAREEMGVLAQMAGLLHDLRRGEKDHAQASAGAAKKILAEFSTFSPDEERYIVEAIANHEAFIEPKVTDSPIGQVISDVLYDADKFRWGPDNFTVTLWQMLRFSQAPVGRLIRRFPKGMKEIARIKDTFRSVAGKTYGPEFIDLGLQIGERIYQFLRQRFAGELESPKGKEEVRK